MTAIDWSTVTSRNLCVFPLLANSKKPAIKSWDPYKLGEMAHPSVVQSWQNSGWQPGVATNTASGITVFEVDSMVAWAEAHERGLPDTFTVKTPRGWHYYFQHPGWPVSNRAGLDHVDGWDVRGDRGYVVGPGSYYIPTADERAKGKVEGAYEIELDVPYAPLPPWLAVLLAPSVPQAPGTIARTAETTSKWGQRALDECIKEIGDAVDGTVNETINRMAFRIAQAVAGGEIVEDEAIDAMQDALDARGIGVEAKALQTMQRGWDAGLEAPRAGPEPLDPQTVFGGRPAPFVADPDVPEPPERTQRQLALTQDQKADKSSHLNIEYWIVGSGSVVRYDEFAGVVRVGKEALTDHLEREIWLGIREASCLPFAWDLFGHTIRGMAWANRYHPLKQYLNRVQPVWDGTPRIDGWLTTYLGVASSEYASAVGSLFLTALVRRARQPGAKFDEMLVLEGPQGLEKSSALAALCPDEAWFTDEVSVGMTSKELLEITGGKWIVEAPELKGLVGRGVDHVKAFMSRRFDKARMSYDRNAIERGREWVSAATTNDGKYLDDPTGNRRIWPVVATSIDVAGIRADRDQLWAEACQREASGASIRMPKHLWSAAADEQAERVLYDSLREDIAEVLGDRTGRVRGKDVLDALRIPTERRPGMSRKFGETMRTLGWNNKLVKVDGIPVRFFVKGDPARIIIYGTNSLDYEATDLRAV